MNAVDNRPSLQERGQARTFFRFSLPGRSGPPQRAARRRLLHVDTSSASRSASASPITGSVPLGRVQPDELAELRRRQRDDAAGPHRVRPLQRHVGSVRRPGGPLHAVRAALRVRSRSAVRCPLSPSRGALTGALLSVVGRRFSGATLFDGMTTRRVAMCGALEIRHLHRRDVGTGFQLAERNVGREGDAPLADSTCAKRTRGRSALAMQIDRRGHAAQTARIDFRYATTRSPPARTTTGRSGSPFATRRLGDHQVARLHHLQLDRALDAAPAARIDRRSLQGVTARRDRRRMHDRPPSVTPPPLAAITPRLSTSTKPAVGSSGFPGERSTSAPIST